MERTTFCHITSSRLAEFWKAMDFAEELREATHDRITLVVDPDSFFSFEERLAISGCERCSKLVRAVYNVFAETLTVEAMLAFMEYSYSPREHKF